MFKRIVNNQALINGLKQVSYGIKRETTSSSSSSDDQQQQQSTTTTTLILIADQHHTTSILPSHHVILTAPNNNNILDVHQFDQFCSNNQLVSSNSVVSKVGKQVLVEMGPRIMEIILQHMNESMLKTHQTKVCNSSSSGSGGNTSHIIATTSGSLTTNKTSVSRISSPSSTSRNVDKSTEKPSENCNFKSATLNVNRFEGKQFYGTNTMFLMDEEIKTTALQSSQTELMLQKSAQIIENESPSNSLGIDTVKALLLDMYGKIAQFVAKLSQQLFGKLFTPAKEGQKNNNTGMMSDIQGNVMLNSICNQSILIVISFMLYEIVIFNSAPTCHNEIQVAFQEFLSKIMSSM
ncbi:hypothetical protein FDP41_000210 [Naegleria fowleri]|uniref:Uncharacterized protein n=1 Tax=Naegleria fowleri TaxID=5763 RepID=A0A6A5CCW3_NAEFO|nr:uncharacterized protein FDP41_000210 [Naegleria fowleri]KAF0985171.1 hypothetical protein FDP41_000210 [Naegleria fowleri]CAG4710029.1 unnamed protein product [Naegleria fowleri]